MNSKIFWDFNCKFTPNGTQTLSKMPCRYPAVYPKLLSHGKDGHVWDIEGREYIDLISGLGCISLGYCEPLVNQYASNQMRFGTSFSLPTVIEGVVAEKLTQLIPWTDMWKFGKTGTDGVLMAVRAARAYTGRTKILTSGYHGCTDHFECLGVRKAGMVDMSEWTHKFIEGIEVKNYAAIVLEPWILDQNIFPYIRKVCDQTGTLLIADEVVTGGRFEGFTASEFIKVQPDLIVLGKAIANGFPLCAVGGKRSIMQTFERDDFFASGTFGGETVSLAACLATLERLSIKVSDMAIRGRVIRAHFNQVFKGLAECEGYPTRLSFKFPSEEHKYLFMQEMARNGVLLGHHNFVMANHTKKDVYEIQDAMNSAYQVLKTYWNNPREALIGKLPEAILRN